jgi:hypothetical protein
MLLLDTTDQSFAREQNFNDTLKKNLRGKIFSDTLNKKNLIGKKFQRHTRLKKKFQRHTRLKKFSEKFFSPTRSTEKNLRGNFFSATHSTQKKISATHSTKKFQRHTRLLVGGWVLCCGTLAEKSFHSICTSVPLQISEE